MNPAAVTPQPSNDDYAYSCDACGNASAEPMPFAEPTSLPGFFFYYCETCGAEWVRDGTPVLRVVAPASEIA